MSTPLPTTPARTAALAEHERQPCTVLELDIDRCSNTYGVLPCTAAGAPGTECYNTYATCQDKPNYIKGVQTIKFISRGAAIPAGETLRPYLLSDAVSPTAIDIEAGLARRGMVTITLADEPDADIQTDPYVATRPAAAGGTFWTRFMRRNLHYAGRTARVRRGFVVSPWDWTTFIDERYIIDSIAGPDSSGGMRIVLKDPLKLADRAKIPAATDGKLSIDIKAVENAGNAQAGAAATVTLAAAASAVDGAYVGMEIVILANTGSGQRRTITAYAGATRIATVAAWAVVPDATSVYEIGRLKITVTGKGAQYADPATSGKREFVRIGDEIIEYTVKAGDVLSWPDTTYRAAFGTTRKDHRANDNVQLCRAFIAQRAYRGVVKSLLNESGIADGLIDLTQLNSEDDTWLNAAYNITACISKPESPTDMIAEILQQTNGVMWWSPALQKVEVKVLMPRGATPIGWTDDANFIEQSVQVKTLDNLRLTSSAIYYSLTDSTANPREAKNYGRGELFVDTSAESAVEYAEQRPGIVYSRWFGAANQVAMHGVVARRLSGLRDAPKEVTFRLDPRDYALPEGEYVDITTRRLTDVTGNPEKTRVMITKVSDRGSHIDMEARTTRFTQRYAFIAPAGTAAYPTDTAYAHMAGGTGLMSDGGQPYLII